MPEETSNEAKIDLPVVFGTTGAPALLRRHTCVLLKQAIPEQEIAAAHAKAHETYASIGSRPMADHPAYFDSHGIVHPELIGDMGEALLDWVEAMVRRTPVIRVMETVLDGPVVAHRPTIRLRRHVPQQMISSVPWHQDSVFLGADSRYVNCWIPLTDCGENAPSLDLYPYKTKSPLEMTAGVNSDYGMNSIEPAELEREFGEHPYWTPSLTVGDCLLFDSSCVHRTSQGPRFTRTRLSVEIRFGL